MGLVAGVDNTSLGLDFELLFHDSLRLIMEASPQDWAEYEIHFVQNLTVSTQDFSFASLAFGLGPGDSRYRAFDLSWKTIDKDVITTNFIIDRLNAKFILPQADITVGRQAITFGKAYFWNPLDIFLPFNAQEFERDYKGGVDAIRIDIPLGDFSGINIVGAPGREIGFDGSYKKGNRTFDASWYASALMARFFTTYKGWDYAAQGGKIYGGYHLGGGLVGEIGEWQIRGEAAHLFAEDSPPLPFSLDGDLVEDHLTAVIGFGRYFPNTLDVEIEYLYNGAGDPDNPYASLIRALTAGNLHLGRHLIGAMASYEFDPLIIGRMPCIYSFSDSSFQIQPTIAYSVDDNSDLQIGAALNFGDRPGSDGDSSALINSEFGSLPDVYYIEYKQYF